MNTLFNRISDCQYIKLETNPKLQRHFDILSHIFVDFKTFIVISRNVASMLCFHELHCLLVGLFDRGCIKMQFCLVSWNQNSFALAGYPYEKYSTGPSLILSTRTTRFKIYSSSQLFPICNIFKACMKRT